MKLLYVCYQQREVPRAGLVKFQESQVERKLTSSLVSIENTCFCSYWSLILFSNFDFFFFFFWNSASVPLLHSIAKALIFFVPESAWDVLTFLWKGFILYIILMLLFWYFVIWINIYFYFVPYLLYHFINYQYLAIIAYFFLS